MFKSKNKIAPIIITVIIIVIIMYLISNVSQPYIECSRKTVDELNITVIEELKAELDSNKIDEMELIKTIILPEEYLEDDTHLNQIYYAIDKSYEYLDDDVVDVTKGLDRIIVDIEIDDNETILLNNLSFYENNGLGIKIISNTKSSEVVTLSINDEYTEGKLMTRLKNNGYNCK